MTTWRLHSHIRVVAIGLHWRNDRLLAAEVRDDAGRIKGVRPLGGEDRVRRELAGRAGA
jgi:hypothetical protein